MFDKILIANRGEIACRVAATARRLGVRTVAVYADGEADAAHVRACDEAVALGGTTAAQSYLQGERILAAALATGAQAIHPGYGFLSENEDFAQACADAGVVFIGPPPEAIRRMGSKAAAKALMGEAGVPLVPGYHGADNAPELLAAEAQRIGYPVLIKASAGGGGKGMRRVDRAEDFEAALASCQREARASFGDDHVLIERYVRRPRHIEIQVFADSQGHCIHLGERDCSVQRRHQKVLEESPAPGLSPERRAEMGAAAIAAARAVGYVGAGTVEFIAEPDDQGDLRFYFMEMNTRLQVEHPVTEAVTGLDLVAWQLKVASGEPLPLTASEIRFHGHAIEARICAENPATQFLPAAGPLSVAHWPAHVRFERHPDLPRLDTGFGGGDAISPHFDSMIAKLIVWGEDRAQALARLAQALDATRLAGLHTNVAFLRRLVRTQAFRTADLDTALIEREHAALFGPPELDSHVAVAAWVGARQLRRQRRASSAEADLWQRLGAWRLVGPAREVVRLQAEGGGAPVQTVVWVPQADDPLRGRLEVDDRVLTLQVRPAPGADEHGGLFLRLQDVEVDSPSQDIPVWVSALGAQADADTDPERTAVFTRDGTTLWRKVDPLLSAAAAGDHGGSIVAPMPAKVLSLLVAEGSMVRRGQALVVMEAMKMEHTLCAPQDGLVEAWLHAPGDQVPEGRPLLRLVDVPVNLTEAG